MVTFTSLNLDTGWFTEITIDIKESIVSCSIYSGPPCTFNFWD